MSGACQPSDCNHTNSTPGSPASQLTLKILRFVSLSVSIIHEPIPYTIQSISTPCLPQECIYFIGLFLSRTLINTIIKIMFDVIDEPVSSKELHQNWVKGGWSENLTQIWGFLHVARRGNWEGKRLRESFEDFCKGKVSEIDIQDLPRMEKIPGIPFLF